MSGHGVIAAFKEGRMAERAGDWANPYLPFGEPFHFAAWEAGFADGDGDPAYSITDKGRALLRRTRPTLADIWPKELLNA